MHPLQFHETGVTVKLKNKRLLKNFLLNLFKKENTSIEKVDIIFCSDSHLLELNNSFLNHDYYTDTMTFTFSKPSEAILGEVYISIDRVKENAEILKINLQTELILVIIHSCLHLCGYNDKHKSDKKKMNHLQEKYLNQWLFHVKLLTRG